MAKKEVGHIEVPFPSPEQGLHSGQHLGAYALGREPMSTSALVAHAWVVAGAGLGMAFPPDGPMESAKPTLTAEEKATLEKFAAGPEASGMKADAVDWRALVKVALTILLRFLA